MADNKLEELQNKADDFLDSLKENTKEAGADISEELNDVTFRTKRLISSIKKKIAGN